MNLAHLLVDAAARTPARTAIIADGERTSFAELDARAAGVAGALRAQGVGAHDTVAFVMANSLESVAAFQGALRIGAVPVPLNPLLSQHEIDARVDESRARLVVVEGLAGPADSSVAPALSEDTAVVLYTSGTTGSPKRVELTHGGLRLSAEATAAALGISDTDVVFGSLPLSHVFGMTGCLNASLAAGACVALVRRFDAPSALALVEAEGVTVFMGVPAMCSALLAAARDCDRTPRLRLAHIGGAPLPAHTRSMFEQRFGARLLEGYGMTEVGGAVTIERADRPTSPGSVGPALTGELMLADDGEILIRAPTLARGQAGWLASGDIGRMDADGCVFLVGRKKDVILRGGYTVYPSEVEAALAEHPSVQEALVVGLPHPTLGEEIGALVVIDGGCSAADLRSFARERLAAYKYPRLIEVVDELPRNPSGKVERRLVDREALAGRLSISEM